MLPSLSLSLSAIVSVCDRYDRVFRFASKYLITYSSYCQESVQGRRRRRAISKLSISIIYIKASYSPYMLSALLLCIDCLSVINDPMSSRFSV